MKLVQTPKTNNTVKRPLNQALDSEANLEVLLEEVPMGKVCCKVLKEVVISVV